MLVDFRSDTATRPSAAMYAAMQSATLGDDCKHEDPSVTQLEQEVADLLGKETGLFFPSGTQSNCTALLTHCRSGDELITGETYHVYRYEGGGASAFGGISFRPLPLEPDGGLNPQAITAAVRPDEDTSPISRLLTLENTTDGKPVSLDGMGAMAQAARSAGLAVHLDGARILNAALALNTTPDQIASHADSVSMCLSKGLGAPVGTVLTGERDFIRLASRWRRKLGGGMRQAGLLAACGKVALQESKTNLPRDHQRTAHFGKALAELAANAGQGRLSISVTPTNMIFVETSRQDLDSLCAKAKEQNMLLSDKMPLRIVLHRDLTDAHTETLLSVFAEHYGV